MIAKLKAIGFGFYLILEENPIKHGLAIASASRDAKFKKKMRYYCVVCPTGIFERLSAPFQINRRIQIHRL